MSAFAKVYDDTQIGQLLVHKDQGDNGGLLSFRVCLKNGMFLALHLDFNDTNEGWDELDAAFDAIDKDKALAVVLSQIKNTPLATLMDA
jgi:hypothetical protein